MLQFCQYFERVDRTFINDFNRRATSFYRGAKLFELNLF